jgi:hypothetical protein
MHYFKEEPEILPTSPTNHQSSPISLPTFRTPDYGETIPTILPTKSSLPKSTKTSGPKPNSKKFYMTQDPNPNNKVTSTPESFITPHNSTTHYLNNPTQPPCAMPSNSIVINHDKSIDPHAFPDYYEDPEAIEESITEFFEDDSISPENLKFHASSSPTLQGLDSGELTYTNPINTTKPLSSQHPMSLTQITTHILPTFRDNPCEQTIPSYLPSISTSTSQDPTTSTSLSISTTT